MKTFGEILKEGFPGVLYDKIVQNRRDQENAPNDRCPYSVQLSNTDKYLATPAPSDIPPDILLAGAFVWDYSPEGNSFWVEVVESWRKNNPA